MPGGRPRMDLNQHKDWLVERVAAGIPHRQIRKDLEAQHGMNISSSTFTRKLAEWKIKTRRDKLEDSEELRARVAECFHVLKLTDEVAYKKLEEEGFSIGKARLAQLRKEMGLFKRCSAADRELAEGAIAKALMQEIKNGVIENMGRRELHNYLRAKYNVIGRDRIYKIATLFDPDGPKRRKAQNGRDVAKRRGHTKPVPDQTRLEAAAEALQEPQMPPSSYPPPQLHMPLHYGI